MPNSGHEYMLYEMSEQLKSWHDANSDNYPTLSSIAKDLDLSTGQLSEYFNGKHLPREKVRIRLFELTKIKVLAPEPKSANLLMPYNELGNHEHEVEVPNLNEPNGHTTEEWQISEAGITGDEIEMTTQTASKPESESTFEIPLNDSVRFPSAIDKKRVKERHFA